MNPVWKTVHSNLQPDTLVHTRRRKYALRNAGALDGAQVATDRDDRLGLPRRPPAGPLTL